MLEQIATGARNYPLPEAGRPTPAPWRSLAAVHPELIAEWHPSRNRKLEAVGISPKTVGARSDRTVWWRCRECGHDWQASVASRRDSGCPACYAQHLRDRSLAVLYPQLPAEWDAERDRALDPYQVGASSERRVWWRCDTCGRGWQAIVKKRTARGQGCPDCGRRNAAAFAAARDAWRQPREASLGVRHPELLAEWHPDRNAGLDPSAIPPRSGRHWIWWRCQFCGHEWRSTPLGRGHSPGGYRSCSRRKAA
jgi:predicted  nucleic acid-binding Zn-ribbon protein